MEIVSAYSGKLGARQVWHKLTLECACKAGLNDCAHAGRGILSGTCGKKMPQPCAHDSGPAGGAQGRWGGWVQWVGNLPREGMLWEHRYGYTVEETVVRFLWCVQHFSVVCAAIFCGVCSICSPPHIGSCMAHTAFFLYKWELHGPYSNVPPTSGSCMAHTACPDFKLAIPSSVRGGK